MVFFMNDGSLGWFDLKWSHTHNGPQRVSLTQSLGLLMNRGCWVHILINVNQRETLSKYSEYEHMQSYCTLKTGPFGTCLR
jgi:hypothetical protein